MKILIKLPLWRQSLKTEQAFSFFLWGRGLTRREGNFVCRCLVFCHRYMAFHFLFPVYLLLVEIPSVHKVEKKMVHYLSMFDKTRTFNTWTYDMLNPFFLNGNYFKNRIMSFFTTLLQNHKWAYHGMDIRSSKSFPC